MIYTLILLSPFLLLACKLFGANISWKMVIFAPIVLWLVALLSVTVPIVLLVYLLEFIR